MSQNNTTAPDLLPNYKLEVPTHLQYVLIAGLGSGIVGLILTFLAPGNQRLFASILLIIGAIAAILTTLVLLVTNNQARLIARRKMMAAVAWRGDEVVLDVGCGNGFLLSLDDKDRCVCPLFHPCRGPPAVSAGHWPAGGGLPDLQDHPG